MLRPDTAKQMATACMLIIPQPGPQKYGVDTWIYPEDGPIIWANMKSYGGTERVSNDLLVIDDTMTMTTWYRPDIAANCRVRIMQTGALYEIIGAPENLELRNQILICKLRRVLGDG